MMKVELEEAGEDTAGMAETVSELRTSLLALSHGKVDIMLDDSTFKSTIDIVRELSVAWKDMTDAERAATLELVAGKRQGNVVAAMLENAELLDDVTKTSQNAAGSALKENERYLDSINGKIQQFTANFQEFATNVLDSELVKGTIDAGSGILGFLNTVTDRLGSIPTLIGTVVTAFSATGNKG